MRIRFLSHLLLWMGLGATWAAFRQPPSPPQLNAEDGETVLLEGCVVEPPIFHQGRERFVLEIAPAARVRVSLLVDDPKQIPELKYGQRMEVAAKVRRPHNFQNPGAFDYVRYLERQQIYWTAFARPTDELKTLTGSCGSSFRAMLFGIRAEALQRIEGMFPTSPYHQALASALLVGEPTRLERIWTEDFRKTGTYHALVISGLHITMLGGFLLAIFRLLRLPKLAQVLLSSMLVWIYALVAGGGAPPVRAAAAFTIFALATLLYRKGRLLNVLAIVTITALALDPDQLFDPSFQLSFLAVAAIGALVIPILDATSAPWRHGVCRMHDPGFEHRLAPFVAETRIEIRLALAALGMPGLIHAVEAFARLSRWAWEGGMATLWIQVGLAIPTILYFHRIPVTSVLANVLAVPFLSASVATGFLALLVPTLPGISRVTGIFIDFGRFLVEWQSAMEPNLRTPDPVPWLLTALAILATICVFQRKVSWILMLGAASAGLFVFLLNPPVTQANDSQLELHMIDVGQGEAMLLTLPGPKHILIDGGGLPQIRGTSKPDLDIGEDVVSPYLWRLGISRLHAIAFTHLHEDHVGGIPALIENFRPSELWTGVIDPQSASWKKISEAARHRGVRARVLKEGDEPTSGLKVVAPAPDYHPGAEPSNHDSLVLLATHGRHRILMTGDLERSGELLLTQSGVLPRVDILKVGHHGSRTSTNPEFLGAVQPAIALVSAGRGNAFRHPHKDVLARLARVHATVYRTDQMGLISLRSDGRYLDVQPFRWPRP
jgi:competence protein ComEC